MDFPWVLVFIYEESDLDFGLKLGCVVGESVDFLVVLRY